MTLNFPSRGLLKSSSFEIGVAPLYVAAHNTAPPAGSHLPAGDSLAILHSLQTRRMLDSKAAEAQAKDLSKKRKSSRMSTTDKPPSAKRVTSSSPFGLTSAQPLGGVPPPSTSATDGAAAYGRVVYTEEGLSTKTQADLKEICQKRKLPVSGKKQVLIDRILIAQLGTGSQ